MKMGMAFDFDKIAEAAGFTADATPAEPAEDSGPKSWPIGKRYDGGHFLVSPEHIELYASATNDVNPAYDGDAGIAPHMLHTRMFKECMFQIATDPELDLDLLRLVHGEHDATFHRPVKAWDLMQVRGELSPWMRSRAACSSPQRSTASSRVTSWSRPRPRTSFAGRRRRLPRARSKRQRRSHLRPHPNARLRGPVQG